MWAFAQAFYISMGTDVEDFNGLDSSMFGLFRTILGDFDFPAIRASNRYLGPTLFILYQLIVFFVMLNMFLAIINKAYEDVVNSPEDDLMAAEFRKGINKWLIRLRALFRLKKVEPVSDSKPATRPTTAASTTSQGGPSAVESEAVKTMLSAIKDLSITVKVLNDKVDTIGKAQARRSLLDISPASPMSAAVASVRRSPDVGISSPADPRYSPSPADNTASSRVVAGPGGVLPPNWKEYKNSKGETYFFNSVTKVSQWDRPSVSMATSELVDAEDEPTPRMK